MVFSTDSEPSDLCVSGKKEKSHGTFGLGYLTPTARCVFEVSFIEMNAKMQIRKILNYTVLKFSVQKSGCNYTSC